MELTFEKAIELLEISNIEKLTSADLTLLERKAKKRWHPDRVAHLKNPELTQEYTLNFQLIEKAVSIIDSYLKGTWNEGSYSNEYRQHAKSQEPEEIIRQNARNMQDKLKDIWNMVREKGYKHSLNEVILSKGRKLAEVLDEDFSQDIAMLSIISFIYSLVLFGLLAALAVLIHPMFGVIMALFWILQALSCLLGLLPLSRFWLPTGVQPAMIWFVNFGLGIYNWAERESRFSKWWVQLFVILPHIVAGLVKYLILMPLYGIAKLLSGEKIIGKVTKRVDYYADLADWYIESLLLKKPELMTSDELFHLSHLYSELSDIKQKF